LDVAAKALNLSVQKSNWLSQNAGTGIFADPKVLEVAFSDEVLNQGNNSTPIELKDGSLMVLRVSEHQKSEAQALPIVSEKIRDLLADQQAQREAGLQAYQVQSDLQDGHAPAAVAKKYSLPLHSQVNIARTNKTLPRELLTTVFGLDSDKKHQASSILVGGKEYAVVLLSSVNTPANPALDEKDRLALQKNLLVLDAQIMYRLYMKSVMSAAKIKIEQSGK
jgi:peptidyl-prolyl cis-trans isomerase D